MSPLPLRWATTPVCFQGCDTCDMLLIKSECGTKMVNGPSPLSSLYSRRWRLKNEAYLFRRSSWGIEDQLRFWATPHSGAGACPSTNSPRSGQGRDKGRKAGEGSEPGSGLFSCDVGTF